jgi:hypothetical protein
MGGGVAEEMRWEAASRDERSGARRAGLFQHEDKLVKRARKR